MRPALVLAAALAAVIAAGCGGEPACSANDAIMKKLAPTCEGCHRGGVTPFFSSLANFETLIAYNPRYVVAGKPDQSYLLDLLRGEGRPPYPQMPLGAQSFAALEGEGKTSVSVAELESWITALVPGGGSARPDRNARTVSRLTAEQIRDTLYQQLGLSDTDFFTPAQSYGVPQLNPIFGDSKYPVRGTDDVPDEFDGSSVATSRHGALGGAQTLGGKRADLSPGSPFVAALVNVSQAWCKLAVAKPDNPLLFATVAPTDTSAQAADAIKQNIAHLHLHFLGEVAVAADVDDVFNMVFVPLETESDPRTAWAGVCAYFIRHPLWVTN